MPFQNVAWALTEQRNKNYKRIASLTAQIERKEDYSRLSKEEQLLMVEHLDVLLALNDVLQKRIDISIHRLPVNSRPNQSAASRNRP